MSEQRRTGEVEKFAHGWGFIIDDKSNESIFVHHSQIDMAGFRNLYPMDRVSYYIGEGRDGKSQAINVVVIEEG